MTNDQFEALAALIGAREGPTRAASRMVLVEGARQADAAAMHGVSRETLNNALRRLRRALELARTAVD